MISRSACLATASLLLVGCAAAAAPAVPATRISFSGRSATVQGAGATASGNIVTVSKAGTYSIAGRLDDGQLIVDTPDKDNVTLVLQNASLSSSAHSPLEVRKAERVVLELPAGSVNVLSDGGASKAALHSTEDLTITGAGSLTVRGTVADGISSKDGLKINGGTITVQAKGDALSVKDQLTVSGGTLRLTAGGGSGGGNKIKGSRGMNVGKMIAIKGGSVTIDAADDALNADEAIEISGGNLSLASGDDAIHAEKRITISGGDVRIAKSYEGIESELITISGGRTQLASADDAINVVSAGTLTANGPSFGFRRRGGGGGGGGKLVITGGRLLVDSGGDGIDSGGDVEMSGGTVIVNGPVERMNGALDYDGDFRLNGGMLVAVGSAGMAQAPGTSSTQNSARVYFDSMLPAGTPVRVATAAGAKVLSFVPAKSFQSLVFSSPSLKTGETYVVYTGGQYAGTGQDGLFDSATYSGGSEQARFTVNSIVSGAGSGGSQGRGRGFRGRM